MKCDVCGKTCLTAQYIWAVSRDTFKQPAIVVKGVVVACQGPACAGRVCDDIDKLCDDSEADGRRWALMDCAAVPSSYKRLLKDYDWSGAGIVPPPKALVS